MHIWNKEGTRLYLDEGYLEFPNNWDGISPPNKFISYKESLKKTEIEEKKNEIRKLKIEIEENLNKLEALGLATKDYYRKKLGLNYATNGKEKK